MGAKEKPAGAPPGGLFTAARAPQGLQRRKHIKTRPNLNPHAPHSMAPRATKAGGRGAPAYPVPLGQALGPHLAFAAAPDHPAARGAARQAQATRAGHRHRTPPGANGPHSGSARPGLRRHRLCRTRSGAIGAVTAQAGGAAAAAAGQRGGSCTLQQRVAASSGSSRGGNGRMSSRRRRRGPAAAAGSAPNIVEHLRE